MEKIISIIIPTYNMEDFIAKNLQSLIIPQHFDDIEVLVVNDGSKDKSSEIAHQFAEKYPRSIKVIDKQNGNYGSCINVGLQHATGKYVKILDADDYFETANFDTMIGILKNVDADLIITHFAFVTPTGETGEIRNLHIPANQILNINDIAHKKTIQGLWMHEIAYRRENVIKMGYHQREGISYTDVQWGFDPMFSVKTVYYINLLIYRYLVGRDGQTMDINIYRKKFGNEFQCTSAMLDTFVSTPLGSKAVKQMMFDKMKGRIIALYKRAMVDLEDLSNEDMIKFDQELKVKSPQLYKVTDRKLLSTPLFCYPYIHAWRKNHEGMLFLFVLKMYKKYKR